MDFSGKPKENEIPGTALTVDLNHNREPWRCQGCQALIYNTTVEKEFRVYPRAGAPMPKAVSAEYDKLCQMCASMYWTLSARTYWIELHRKWVEEQKRRKKLLGDGKDYLT